MKKVLSLFLLIISLGLVGCKKEETYVVKFIDELGLIEQTEVIVNKDECVTKPNVPNNSQYDFIGWYTDSNFVEDSLFIFTTKIDKSFSLYAKWEKKSVEEIMIGFIDSLIASTPSYIPAWNKESFKGRWNYIDGVFLNSMISLYKKGNNTKYMDFVINYINYYITSNGTFINPQTGDQEYRSNELDTVCASKILFDAYEYTKDTRYLTAIEYTYDRLMEMPIAINSPNFWHKLSYENQIWLDGMYMYAPFLARYAKFNNYLNLFSLIKSQYEYIRNNMFDDEAKLYYHGHDTTKTIFWANSETGNSSSFWLRSMGWYIVSLVDILEYFPKGNDYDYLEGLLKEAIDGILAYQDETKMFYQLVDKENASFLVEAKYLSALKNTKYYVNGVAQDTHISNYLESSGSSMIAYALLKGSKLGYLANSYLEIGKSTFVGIYDHSFKNNELNDICITAGLGPNTNPIRDGSASYYLAEPVGSNDAKGVGPFIMAYLEFMA